MKIKISNDLYQEINTFTKLNSNCELIEGFYIDKPYKSNLKIVLKCDCGDIYETRWEKFSSNKSCRCCPKCTEKIRRERWKSAVAKRNPIPQNIKEKLIQFGMSVEDVNSYSQKSEVKIPLKCPQCGYEWKPYLCVIVKSLEAGNCGCPACERKAFHQTYAIANTHPEFVKYFVNKEEAYLYSAKSSHRIDVICPICGSIKKNMKISNLTKGFSCDLCGSKRSYPERVLFSFLLYFNVIFEAQKSFDWSFIEIDHKKSKKYYDFYLPDYHLIIETHGIQHYVGGNPFEKHKTVYDIKANDRQKHLLALQNNFNYLEIDCRYSNFEYIKNKIIESNLLQLIGKKPTSTDWKTIEENANKNITTIQIASLFNDGFTVKEISKSLKINRTTTISYLKKATAACLCNYNSKDFYKNIAIKTGKPVYCLSDDKLFISTAEAASYANCSSCGISSACHGRQQTAGGKEWMFGIDAINKGIISQERFHSFYETAKARSSRKNINGQNF